jgi:hypothetical protein
MNCEVAAQHCAFAGSLGLTNLTDDDLAILDFLATKQLNPQALAGTVVDVFGGTASFYV